MHRESLREVRPRRLIAGVPSRIVLTGHAWRQLRRRPIPEDVMIHVVTRPEQVIRTTPIREVRQSIVTVGTRPYLVRVVTVYRTSQVARYWRAT
jgi:hypothetical protein